MGRSEPRFLLGHSSLVEGAQSVCLLLLSLPLLSLPQRKGADLSAWCFGENTWACQLSSYWFPSSVKGQLMAGSPFAFCPPPVTPIVLGQALHHYLHVQSLLGYPACDGMVTAT